MSQPSIESKSWVWNLRLVVLDYHHKVQTWHDIAWKTQSHSQYTSLVYRMLVGVPEASVEIQSIQNRCCHAQRSQSLSGLISPPGLNSLVHHDSIKSYYWTVVVQSISAEVSVVLWSLTIQCPNSFRHKVTFKSKSEARVLCARLIFFRNFLFTRVIIMFQPDLLTGFQICFTTLLEFDLSRLSWLRASFHRY